MDTSKIQSEGGKARAASLTSEERSEIAERASNARWSTPEAAFATDDLILGETAIPCAVIETSEGPVRVINSLGFMTALGRPWKGSYKRTNRPNFLDAGNLQPFITNELSSVLSPIEYRASKGGAKKLGYKAEMIPMVCEVYLRAREEGVLMKSQLPAAKACEIIMRGLARVGIVALVDEATGYQEVRAKSALAEILEKFIAKEFKPWTKTFPFEFYENLFRLRGWKFDSKTMQGPRAVAQYTEDLVYKRLAPGVLDELKSKNPRIDGRRKKKHHQWLTGDIGHPKLMSHIEGIKTLMIVSDDWDSFMKRVDKVYPKYELTEMGFEIELKTKSRS